MSAAKSPPVWGMIAEFRTPDELVRAATAVREAGYQKFDCHAPFPVHGLDAAMGIKPTILPWIVLGAGIIGGSSGLLMEWWMNAFDYPIIISGKPFWSIPSSIPVAYEFTILLASLTAFAGMLVLNGLPQWSHPLFKNDRFRRVTDDRFFISIEKADPKYDLQATERLLREAGSMHVALIED